MQNWLSRLRIELKGTAGTLRANRISDVAARMESNARDGELLELQSQLKELLQEFQNFTNACRPENQDAAVRD